MSSKELEANLFTTAMRGEWEKVVQMYEDYPEIHRAKITRSGDTALHIAISDEQDSIVEQLVDLITKSDKGMVVEMEALMIENERGNTPLHLAASLGNVRMCKCIANVNPILIGCRNHNSETPFFLAALHGRKDAFLCLHSFLQNKYIPGYIFCRRNDGDTILHCAIAGEYFDLAFQIINLYEKLVDSVNEQGISPLHLLANKPSAFRSGSHMTKFYKFIYHCIFVDKLEIQKKYQRPPFQELEYSESAKYPENYQVCANFTRLIGKVFCLFVGSGKRDSRKQSDAEDPNREQLRKERDRIELNLGIGAQKHQLFPANYLTFFEAIKLVSKAMLNIFGLGSRELLKVQERKERHVWSEQILDELLQRISTHHYENHGRDPQQPLSVNDDKIMPSTFRDDSIVGLLLSETELTSPPKEDSEERDSQHDSVGEKNKKTCADGEAGKRETLLLIPAKEETPLLIAAKNGVTEMVEKILKQFPMAIHDVNSDLKNIVLLAVEHRQPHVYELLLEKKIVKQSIFGKVDKDGNSALHLAARLGEYRPWLIPGAALQMQWEIKWYEYVKNSIPLNFFVRLNLEGKTPKDIFTETHKELVKSGGEWLKSTAESCFVINTLIAAVAFATAATVPGGVKPDKGTPVLENEPAFECFAISSLIALSFSLTSVVLFLSILTSRHQEKDFRIRLPSKLLLGLTSLFISMASMLISFCAGHFFVLKEKLKYAAFPVYGAICLPVTVFAMAQFRLYFDLIWAALKKVPQRGYRVVPL